MTDKILENRLRRVAARRGYRLTRSRSRDPHAVDHGLYALADIQTNGIVNEPIAGRWMHSWTLGEVEEFLTVETAAESA